MAAGAWKDFVIVEVLPAVSRRARAAAFRGEGQVQVIIESSSWLAD